MAVMESHKGGKGRLLFQSTVIRYLMIKDIVDCFGHYYLIYTRYLDILSEEECDWTGWTKYPHHVETLPIPFISSEPSKKLQSTTLLSKGEK